jgi:hypothetical protein
VLVRFGNILLITALLAATGAHWAVLQSVAWTTMFADNLRSGPLVEAIQKTFDGKHACSLCVKIKAGQKSEKKPRFCSSAQRLEFVNQRNALTLFGPEAFMLLPHQNFHPSDRQLQPPTPPPRTGLGGLL